MTLNQKDYDSTNLTRNKRKRLYGACDICKQKKVKCMYQSIPIREGSTYHAKTGDSALVSGNRCSNCIAFNSECTHDIYLNKSRRKPKFRFKQWPNPNDTGKPPPKHSDLKDEMRSVVQTILSAPTFQPPANPALIRDTITNLAAYARILEEELSDAHGTQNTSGTDPSCTIASSGMHDGDGKKCPVNDIQALSEHFEHTLVLDGSRCRFFGPSSIPAFVQRALEVGKARTISLESGAETPQRRTEFWNIQPWELASHQAALQNLTFPESDLLRHLVDLYFARVNIHTLLLHRPTFETHIKTGLHLVDRRFGKTVLAVCALASRYSEDSRVLLEDTNSERSCGWKWFRQLDFFSQSFLQVPSLSELQTCCLAIIYLGSSAPEKCWYLTGFGIRAAQDLGIHRRKRGNDPPTIEGELGKRVFWVLNSLDIIICATLGRPRATNPCDYDLELPIECDDEYWEHPDKSLAFVQPPGQPAVATFFVLVLKLFEILSSAQLVFYPIRQPEIRPGMSVEEWKHENLAGLDSSLNAWLDGVPNHLKWDPQKTDRIFFDHRIMEVQSNAGSLAIPQAQAALFTSGVILLLGIWSGKRLGLLLDEGKEMEAVQRCVSALRTYESRWQSAGRFCDVLAELVSITRLHLPRQSYSVPSSEEWNASHSLVLPDQGDAVEGGMHADCMNNQAATLPTLDLFQATNQNKQAPSQVTNTPCPTSAPQQHAAFSSEDPMEEFSWHTTSDLNLDALEIWSTVPSGYDWADWGTYIANFGEMVQDEAFEAPT